jgi:NAD(P)-dependent dehydrogenase (short-subunit alcohol dehydrogenase family)
MIEGRTALEVVDGVDLAGKTCVVTGASSGLGRESARALAAAGAYVILAARNSSALAETQDWLRAEVAGARTSVVHLDLTSLVSVRAAADAIEAISPAVHVLMNNAGVMFAPFGRTVDGFETHMATNHLGHFQLTRLLMPQLVAAKGARIVILSSGGHRIADIDLDDPNWADRGYDKFAAYGASKTANILHMVELDRRLAGDGIRAYSVCPGAVATSLARHMSRPDFSRMRGFTDRRLDYSMPDVGAATQVWAAVSPDLAGVGCVYLEKCQVTGNVAPYAVDADRAAKLWDVSEYLCDGGSA